MHISHVNQSLAVSLQRVLRFTILGESVDFTANLEAGIFLSAGTPSAFFKAPGLLIAF
jgi:hypothetical protein